MKSSPPLTAIAIAALTFLTLFGISCTKQPAQIKIAFNFTPTGKTLEYKLESHRVGSIFKNGEHIDDFDTKVEGDIIYTTQKVLPNGDCMVLEENVWSWDEPTGDSGQVKRITRDYAYKYEIAPSGKMTDLKMLGEPSKPWEDYVKSFVEQGVPVFPDEAVAAGYQWVQKASVILPDSQTYEAITTYTVKGTANKSGYDCIIIEYKGNLAVPLFQDPDDSLSASGVDWIELNGMLYFAIDAGITVNSEEKRRVVSERVYFDKNTGEKVVRRQEFDSVISTNLASLETG